MRASQGACTCWAGHSRGVRTLCEHRCICEVLAWREKEESTLFDIPVLLVQALVVLRVVRRAFLADVRVCGRAGLNLAGDPVGERCLLGVVWVAAINGGGVHGLVVGAPLAGEAVVGGKLVPSRDTAGAQLEAGVGLAKVELLQVALADGQVAGDVRVGAEGGGAVLALGLCLVEDDVVDVEVGDVAHVKGHDVGFALAGVFFRGLAVWLRTASRRQLLDHLEDIAQLAGVQGGAGEDARVACAVF